MEAKLTPYLLNQVWQHKRPLHQRKPLQGVRPPLAPHLCERTQCAHVCVLLSLFVYVWGERERGEWGESDLHEVLTWSVAGYRRSPCRYCPRRSGRVVSNLCSAARQVTWFERVEAWPSGCGRVEAHLLQGTHSLQDLQTWKANVRKPWKPRKPWAKEGRALSF